jgi:hypothetical protein
MLKSEGLQPKITKKTNKISGDQKPTLKNGAYSEKPYEQKNKTISKMKKVFLISTMIIAFVVLTAFKATTILKINISECASALQQEETTFDVYIMQGGSWIKGQITYVRTQQGFTPIRYHFSDQLRGAFWPDQRFMPLNPNNELAKKHNFTHTINTGGATAYLILY